MRSSFFGLLWSLHPRGAGTDDPGCHATGFPALYWWPQICRPPLHTACRVTQPSFSVLQSLITTVIKHWNGIAHLNICFWLLVGFLHCWLHDNKHQLMVVECRVAVQPINVNLIGSQDGLRSDGSHTEPSGIWAVVSAGCIQQNRFKGLASSQWSLSWSHWDTPDPEREWPSCALSMQQRLSAVLVSSTCSWFTMHLFG